MMFASLPEFDDHRSIHYIHEPSAQLRAFICIHRGNVLTPSFGATRLWKYRTETEALQDALRLSKLMTSKAAHAGLIYGGAKAVIMEPDQPYDRKHLLKAYTLAVDSLNGRFVTGTDVGLQREDVIEMKRSSRFFVGINADPTIYTALGILESLKAVFTHLDGSQECSGKSFAIQGVGKIGFELLKHLAAQASAIYISDLDAEKLSQAKNAYPNVQIVSPEEIHKQTVDVFMPCALSGAINPVSIKQLQCRAIVGAANNQMSSEDMAEQLHRQGILYAPDYVANAGGLISVVHEFEYQSIKEELLREKISGIYDRMLSIFTTSKEERISPVTAANYRAQSHLSVFHTGPTIL